MTRVAWGALLQGASEEIADWTEVLKPGFDPWIETHGADTVLRSRVLDGLGTASEVHEKAGALIDVLKGAVALSQGAGPLKYGGVRSYPQMASSTNTFSPHAYRVGPLPTARCWIGVGAG